MAHHLPCPAPDQTRGAGVASCRRVWASRPKDTPTRRQSSQKRGGHRTESPWRVRLFPATVDDGGIAANAAGGWLHNLGGDAYVVRPACFLFARCALWRYDGSALLPRCLGVAPLRGGVKQGPARAGVCETGGLPPTKSRLGIDPGRAFGSLAGIHKEERRWNRKTSERPPS